MKKLVVISGPTAAGKTKLSIELAKAIGGEIISADSMQVYKYMDIGSAKITEEEKEGIPHHLIDILEPSEDFNVALFKELAEKAIDDILMRRHIPILVGGTGFYIHALLYDAEFGESDGEIPEIRRRLESEAEENPCALYERLKAVDPESAEIIHKNNVKRVIRALEFYEETGRKISDHNNEMHKKKSPYLFSYFVLTKERAALYEGIDRRVDKMLSDGLVSEVNRLKDMGITRECTSMQGLGYKEILDYLDGKITLEDAVYIIKRDTRHFAKRQLTWFRREEDCEIINKDEFKDEEEILQYMLKELKSKEII